MRRSDQLRAALPAPSVLATGLTRMLGQVEVLARKPNIHATTFPSEVVTIRSRGGPSRRLLLKYTAGYDSGAPEHRGDLGYEAVVYRDVLSLLDVPVPSFAGWCQGPDGLGPWLAVGYLERAVRVYQLVDPMAALTAAARWVGRLHRTAGTLQGPTPLRRYDARYYRGWATRAADRVDGRPDGGVTPRLQGLLARLVPVLEELAETPASLVHGECTCFNVLVGPDGAWGVDWQAAAMGAAEVDLAALTEHWPDREVAAAETAYLESRFGRRVPAGFARRLDLARLYWALRWLADDAGWTSPTLAQRRMADVVALAGRLRIG